MFFLYIIRRKDQRSCDVRGGCRGPKSYDNTETVVLYIIYITPFSASVVQRKENLYCSLHKMMETGELFVVYSECDEDRSSEAARG